MYRVPKYRLHKARNVAVVTIDGKDHYLGEYNSAASRQRYHRLLLDKLSLPNETPATALPLQHEAVEPARRSMSINELILHYWKFANSYYQKNGKPTSELDCIRHALGFLRRCAGEEPALQFGPKALKAVRDSMLSHPITRKRCHPKTGVAQIEVIAQGLTRKVINTHIGRIKRLFRWAVQEEILPVTVYQALLTLAGLKRGRSTARERPRIRPVLENDIQAVVPHLQPMMAAMIKIHRLCGCRSQDILCLRGIDLDRNQAVWEYRPAHYKTEHLNDESDPDLE